MFELACENVGTHVLFAHVLLEKKRKREMLTMVDR